MTEKHNWVTDDLCLIEETTGVKLYGTVCTDISFIAKQLNMANKTIRELEGENEQSKMMIATLRNIVLEHEDLEKENKELKQFKEQLFDIIDERIKYHRKYSTLTVRIPMDCKYRKECLENHSVNVCNKAKENAYKELKKELGE